HAGFGLKHAGGFIEGDEAVEAARVEKALAGRGQRGVAVAAAQSVRQGGTGGLERGGAGAVRRGVARRGDDGLAAPAGDEAGGGHAVRPRSTPGTSPRTSRFPFRSTWPA